MVVVTPPLRFPRPRLGEVWEHRELLMFLVWRNIKLRYRQTFVGFWWALFQPLASVVAFTLVFDGIADVPSAGLPYPFFVLTGLLPWTFFSNSVNAASISLVLNVSLVSKIYFPRLLLPVSAVITALSDLASSLVLLIVAMIIYAVAPGWPLLALPGLVALLVLAALSIGIWLSAINVKYRDVAYAVPYLIQLGLFLTPVIYPTAAVPEGALRLIYALNPMVAVIEGFRWSLAGADPPGAEMLISSLVILLLLLAGLITFARTEQTFADVI